ncbi:peptidogalycan biosysnthesis protein [Sporosarcina limicola]|uniref:N-acyltransferase n=1 Tax=Sporosarcina limicola TaxID=34101 RepID=A0A927MIN3_9BACL|nr:peptidogalycan biosysnthesis protein [Sporosarcina limicola]MBE1555100.1 putative N-acyltransferase [Sporosarcina limicola]
MDIIIHKKYNNIAKEHREIIEENFLNSNEFSKEWFLFLEKSLPEYEPLYIIGLMNNNIVNFCTGYNIKKLDMRLYLSGISKTIVNFLERIHLNLFKFNVVFLTNPLSNYCGIKSENYSSFNEFMEKSKRKIYRELKSASIFANNIYDEELSENLSESGFIKIPFYPNTVLNTAYETFDSYLASLNKKKRWDVRNKIKIFNNYGAEIHMMDNKDIGDFDDIYMLYKNTSQKNDDFPNLINYSKETFCNWKDMSNAYKWIIIKVKERVIGFALLVKEENFLLFKHVGLDYKDSKECYAYFNLYYAAIKYAIEGNYQFMYCGTTTYDTKKSLGCELVETSSYISFKSKYVQKIITRILTRAFK